MKVEGRIIDLDAWLDRIISSKLGSDEQKHLLCIAQN